MLTTILAWISAHGLPALLAVFTFASLVLSGLAALLTALGDALPGWLGSAISAIAGIVHFLNGNTSAGAQALVAKK